MKVDSLASRHTLVVLARLWTFDLINLINLSEIHYSHEWQCFCFYGYLRFVFYLVFKAFWVLFVAHVSVPTSSQVCVSASSVLLLPGLFC